MSLPDSLSPGVVLLHTSCGCHQGFSASTNPYFDTRKRFQKLYVDFRVEFVYWRLVLLGRKLLLVITAIMFNQNPMFQVCTSL